jgi:hypothetical protein
MVIYNIAEQNKNQLCQVAHFKNYAKNLWTKCHKQRRTNLYLAKQFNNFRSILRNNSVMRS